jgi:Uma2 family endonuclease
VTLVIKSKLTLPEFLLLPETQPASELINGEILQKPMPQGEHSRLQSKLCMVINQIAEIPKIAYAFPELRCTFGGDSIIPDVAVMIREGEIPDFSQLQYSGL